MSLVEVLAVVAVVGILASLAMPAFGNLAARQRLRGVADNLRGDLHFARSEAIKRQSHVYVVFSPGAQWCYAITTSTSCGCGTPCAQAEALLRQTSASDVAPGVELQSASFAASFCGTPECVRFEAFHGTAMGSNGTATFRGAEGSQYKVIVSALGRVRACRASGDAGGFLPSC